MQDNALKSKSLKIMQGIALLVLVHGMSKPANGESYVLEV